MHTMIKTDGDRSIRIAVSTTAEALASTPIKVKSFIKKRINATRVSLVRVIWVSVMVLDVRRIDWANGAPYRWSRSAIDLQPSWPTTT